MIDPEYWATSTTRFPWKRQGNGEIPRPDQWEPTKEELSRIEQASQQCSSSSHHLQKAVIVYLITRPVDLEWFYKHAITRLWFYFLQKWAYPVLVFVPSAKLRLYDPESFDESPNASYVEEMLQENQTMRNMNIKVVEYDMQFPESVRSLGNWKDHQNECARSVPTQYKHMNHFFTEKMYQHPALVPYNYYMRLDADLMLQKEVPSDPFCMLKKTGRKFMFQTRHVVRDSFCSEGMWEWFETYAQANNLPPRDKKIWGSKITQGTYVGYIGVGDLRFFRSERVAKVARAFNQDGRVYLARWSDQTYYVILLALLEDHDSVGDVGMNWSSEVWCHKCKPGRKSTLNSLMGLPEPTEPPFVEPKMPNEPGCWYWMPSGCRSDDAVVRKYRRSIRKAPTEEKCLNDVSNWYNIECERTDARMVYVSPQ